VTANAAQPGRPAARRWKAIGPVARVLSLMARAGCGRMVNEKLQLNPELGPAARV
jgi:hypothetical protein